MQLVALQGTALRCFTEFSLTPVSGVNLLLGENGAGKTSLIEAIHILGYGRSFRARIRDGLIKHGADALQITTRWQDHLGNTHQAGLRHSGNDWQARQNGAEVDSLSQFCSQFPVLSFEPGSHALISGAADNRRRFLDWALFHVEPEFFPQWRRFSRALKQRNSLLKTRPSAQALAAWDKEYAESGEAIHYYRQQYLQTLVPGLQKLSQQFLPECGDLALHYSAGWRQSQMSLLDALRLSQERDLQSGFCHMGPHRADWQLDFNAQLHQSHFSRGQAKLLALAAQLAQAELFHAEKGFWPILCFDDLASELDTKHFLRVLHWLSETQAQIWISGTEDHLAYRESFAVLQRFHVEHGRISGLPKH
jgi:DNA replication and repair protein RecF